MVYITSQLALTNFLGMGNCSLNTSHLNRVRKSRQAASSSPSSRRPNRSDRQFRVSIRANEFPIITFCHHIFSIFLSAASAGGRKSCASCEPIKGPERSCIQRTGHSSVHYPGMCNNQHGYRRICSRPRISVHRGPSNRHHSPVAHLLVVVQDNNIAVIMVTIFP